LCLKAVGEENILCNQKSDKSLQDSRTQEIKSRMKTFNNQEYLAKRMKQKSITNIFKISPYNLLGAAKFENKFLSNQNIKKISKPNNTSIAD